MLENGKLATLNIRDILPNRFQPRIHFDEQKLNELAESISKYGLIQPIVVRQIGTKYEIIAGERRYKASSLANKETIPAIIVNLSDRDSEEIALLENIQREDLTPIEEAVSYKRILDVGYISLEQLSRKIGKSQIAILNKMRLLNLDDIVQDALLHGKISERHARSLLKIKNSEKQVEMLNRIINERLTVKMTDREISNMLNVEADKIETLSTTDRPVRKAVPVASHRIIKVNPPKELIDKLNKKGEERVDTMDIDKILEDAQDIAPNEEAKSDADMAALMEQNLNTPTSPVITNNDSVVPTTEPAIESGKFVMPGINNDNSLGEENSSNTAETGNNLNGDQLINDLGTSENATSTDLNSTNSLNAESNAQPINNIFVNPVDDLSSSNVSSPENSITNNDSDLSLMNNQTESPVVNAGVMPEVQSQMNAQGVFDAGVQNEAPAMNAGVMPDMQSQMNAQGAFDAGVQNEAPAMNSGVMPEVQPQMNAQGVFDAGVQNEAPVMNAGVTPDMQPQMNAQGVFDAGVQNEAPVMNAGVMPEVQPQMNAQGVFDAGVQNEAPVMNAGVMPDMQPQINAQGVFDAGVQNEAPVMNAGVMPEVQPQINAQGVFDAGVQNEAPVMNAGVMPDMQPQMNAQGVFDAGVQNEAPVMNAGVMPDMQPQMNAQGVFDAGVQNEAPVMNAGVMPEVQPQIDTPNDMNDESISNDQMPQIPILPGIPGAPINNNDSSIDMNIPDDDILEDSTNVESVEQINNKLDDSAKFRQVINIIRNCSSDIEKLGFYIDTEEIDLGDKYQVTFKIDKQ